MGKDKGYVNACTCICDVLYSGVCVCEWAQKKRLSHPPGGHPYSSNKKTKAWVLSRWRVMLQSVSPSVLVYVS